jgi:hypothetical protein
MCQGRRIRRGGETRRTRERRGIRKGRRRRRM